MKITPNNEKPWVRDYLKEDLAKPEDFFPLIEIKITAKGGYILITDSFKCYLFPESGAALEFKHYLAANDGKDVPNPGIEITSKYPFWLLSDDTDTYINLHNYDNKEIQLTPPSPPEPATRLRGGKKPKA